METIQKNWQLALDILQPTKKDLEHGLELHRNSYVFDAYGFNPSGGGKFPSLDELIRQHASRDELNYALEEFCKVQSFRDPAMRKLLAEAREKSGVDCIFQNSGVEGNDIENMLKRLGFFTALVDRMDGFFERAVFPDQLEGIRERGHKALL